MGHERERWRARNVGASFVAALVLSATLATSLCAGAAQSSQAHGATPILLTRAGFSSFVYVLWAVPCGSLDCFRLQRLSGSGRGSAPVLPTPLARSKNYYADGGLEQLVFANVDDGYALVSSRKGESTTLYATFDGARTWHREMFAKGETPESIAASQNAFYAVDGLTCPKVHEDCATWRISRSSIGSSKWRAVSRSYRFGHDSSYPFVAAFASHVFITTQEQSEPGHTIFGASDDDGASFKVFSVPNLSSVADCALLPTSPGTIWAECDDGMMTGTVEVSTDGGSHWRILDDVPRGEPFEFGTIDPVSNDLAYANNGEYPSQLWRVGADADRSVAAGELPHPMVAALSFVDSTEGFALSSPIGPESRQVLYETSDAGVHWKRLFM